MRRPYAFCGALLLIVSVGLTAFALDDISATMKRMLDDRGNNFASIRKDPHGEGDGITYQSSVVVAGAKACYISQFAKPWYSASCNVLETKSRDAMLASYKKYGKSLREAVPASWISWTEPSTRPKGEAFTMGPDRAHPAAAVQWTLEGMNLDWYELTVTFYADGYSTAGKS